IPQLPVSNSSVVIGKEKQGSIKSWMQKAYGVALTNLDANVGETFISEDKKHCTVHILKEGLLDTDIVFDADNNVCKLGDRDDAIKAKYENVAKVYQERLVKSRKAAIGSGIVNVVDK
ncbi:MAG: hypothetical protein ACTSPB_12575, partial [Candidatus Thorarchaeota archaeon]